MARDIMGNRAIADDKQTEQVLKGIQPKNQLMFRIFKLCRWFAIGFAVFDLIMFGLTFVPTFRQYTGTAFYRHIILYVLVAIAGCILLATLIKLLFLRKAPFDDWVWDIAQKRLGTEVIFYDSHYIYIDYDRTGKEVDKREFVTEMSDKSIHYSYFYVKTFIDRGVIQVECKKRTPIPKMASFTANDDPYWNMVPLGLTLNNVTQQISPIAWILNDKNKNPNNVETVPSTSILICGGTGSGKSVLEQSM